MQTHETSSRLADDAPPPVRVDGVEISEAAIAREIQNHPAPDPAQARAAAAQSLVVRELLLNRAHALGLTAEPGSLGDGRTETEDDALIRVLLEREVSVPSPTDAECRRFYDLHQLRFRSPDIVEASHILFSAAPDDTAACAGAMEAARSAIVELREDPKRFEALATALSTCPSAAQGGHLGQISPGQTAPEFEAVLAELRPGEIAGTPVQTRFGVHVVRLGRRFDSRTLPFDVVQEKIADYLSDAVFHRAVHQYIALLAGSASVEGIDLTRATSPLVQ